MKRSRTRFLKPQQAIWITLAVIFILGTWIRLIDLQDPPLDFNPTRQLRSAIIARGYYYEHAPSPDPDERDTAMGHKRGMEYLEPPVLEMITSWIYLLAGKEILWVARVLTSICWVVGGTALFDLGRRMTSPPAALIALLYYFFIPFSIRASRSFQPDPVMVMLVLLAAWTLYHWSVKPTWKWTIMTGLTGGISAFIKPAGFLFVGGMVLGLILFKAWHQPSGEQNKSIPIFKNTQGWAIVGLMAAFVIGYYLIQTGKQSTGYFTSWTIISRWRELLTPSFYVQWLLRIDSIMYLSVVTAGFIGMLIAVPKNRALLAGFWAGYIFLGFLFPHHIITHDYYHLPLVGLVSLSMTPLIEVVLQKILDQQIVFRIAFIVVVLVFFGYNGWIGRSILVGQDYREHPAFWQKVASAFPEGSKAIGLTQDYGYRLMYYGWRKIDLWPQGESVENFSKVSSEADYFVITAKNQLNNELENYLEDTYSVHSEGIGYQIFDIRTSK